MLAGNCWNHDKLFFFDKGKRKRFEKRQKKPTDSLPISLLRDIRPAGIGPQGGRNRKNLTYLKDSEAESDQTENILQDEEQSGGLPLKNKRKVQVDFRLQELDDYDDEDTQKFLYEEAKFSAPNLLAQIEKFLIILKNFRNSQKHEIDELHEEIESVYGERWGKNVLEERTTVLDISDKLYERLLWDFEQLAAGTVYLKREWQTSVYRELAALHDIKNYPPGDFLSLVSSPDAALKGFNEKLKMQTEDKFAESDRKSEKSF